MNPSRGPLTEVVGVYHADGGLLGELRYVVGKVRGTAHCALCDITHGNRVRAKRSWQELVANLGVPLRVVHLDEMAPDVARAVAEHGSPVVLGRRDDGSLVELLSAEELDAAGGSVTTFERALAVRLAR